MTDLLDELENRDDDRDPELDFGCRQCGSKNFRITGEVRDSEIRLRCKSCTSEIGWVDNELLNLVGIPDDEIYAARFLHTPITIEVDLR